MSSGTGTGTGTGSGAPGGVSYGGTVQQGSQVLTLAGTGPFPGINIGMSIDGPGIPGLTVVFQKMTDNIILMGAVANSNVSGIYTFR